MAPFKEPVSSPCASLCFFCLSLSAANKYIKSVVKKRRGGGGLDTIRVRWRVESVHPCYQRSDSGSDRRKHKLRRWGWVGSPLRVVNPGAGRPRRVVAPPPGDPNSNQPAETLVICTSELLRGGGWTDSGEATTATPTRSLVGWLDWEGGRKMGETASRCHPASCPL